MNLGTSALPFLLLVVSHIASAAPKNSDITGAWSCGPYEIKGADFDVSVIDRRIYSADGKFSELGTATYTLPDGTQMHVETRHIGNWTLAGDVIEIQYTSAEFLSSDNALFSVADGQASLDAQMRRKSWSKKRVLGYGERLVTIPMESLYKQAEVQVSCSRA